MIEKILLDYLNITVGLSAVVYAEQPKDKPSAFFVLEKAGGGMVNQIFESNITIQSYAESKYKASCMNEEVKAAMLKANELDAISAVELNSDYDYTDTSTKTYRYQAVFVITHY